MPPRTLYTGPQHPALETPVFGHVDEPGDVGSVPLAARDNDPADVLEVASDGAGGRVRLQPCADITASSC